MGTGTRTMGARNRHEDEDIEGKNKDASCGRRNKPLYQNRKKIVIN